MKGRRKKSSELSIFFFEKSSIEFRPEFPFTTAFEIHKPLLGLVVSQSPLRELHSSRQRSPIAFLKSCSHQLPASTDGNFAVFSKSPHSVFLKKKGENSKLIEKVAASTSRSLFPIRMIFRL